jgi:hypothetical protein
MPGNRVAIDGLGRMEAMRGRWDLVPMSYPANSPSITDPLRELDRRCNDGIDVRLLWRPSDNRVLVAVDDGKTGERFSIEVLVGGNALDVFRHPYAYAAWHGIDTHSKAEALTPAALGPRARSSS